MKKKLLFLFLVFSFVHVTAVPLFAQRWADAMFEERRHNFGTVAIGVGVETIYRFKFKNHYAEELHISDVTSSCRCTVATPSKKYIKPGETGEIIAKLNTGGAFTGSRQATLTVLFDQPSAEVQLQVTAYIRPDVVITPGVADFGSVSEGKNAVKKLKIEYAGRDDWSLEKIERTNPGIKVVADIAERGDGRVVYDITVTLKDNIPSGYIHDMVRFITNDPNPESSSIMLPVQGYIAAPLVAKPSPFTVGFLAPGKTITKNLVLRSETPFQIVKAFSADKRFQFALADTESTTIHIVPITFKANSNSGDITEPIIFQTTLDNQQEIHVWTQGRVTPQLLQNEQNDSRSILAENSSENKKTNNGATENAIANISNAQLKPLTGLTARRSIQKNKNTDVPSLLPSPPQLAAETLVSPLTEKNAREQPHVQMLSPVKIAAEQTPPKSNALQESIFESIDSTAPKNTVPPVAENRLLATANASAAPAAKQVPSLDSAFEIASETPQQFQASASVSQKNLTDNVSKNSSAAPKSNGLIFVEPSIQENLTLTSQPKQKVVNMTDVFTLENGKPNKNQISKNSENAFESVTPTQPSQLVTQLEAAPRTSKNDVKNENASKAPDFPFLSKRTNDPIQITVPQSVASHSEIASTTALKPENLSTASEDAAALIASLMGESNQSSDRIASQKITPQSIPNHSLAAELKPLETPLTDAAKSPSVTPQLLPLPSPILLPPQQENQLLPSEIAAGERLDNEFFIRRLPDRQTFEREAMRQPEQQLQQLSPNTPPERVALAPQTQTTQNPPAAPNLPEVTPLRSAQLQGQLSSPPNNATNKNPNTWQNNIPNTPRSNVRNGMNSSQNTRQPQIAKPTTNPFVATQPPPQNNAPSNNKRPTPPRPTIAPAPVFR
ncbi:MAG: DUF1573 domain-containing protein [Planctomycetaceae bacterium]|jgi:hypothetical protein|nr:DUF1573 domain-containing protein [Planctomycetaceae bacterium]